MTDSFVTQCPHCRTSFRVSRAQLGAAHGAVRCGACMQVFNAAQHLLGEPTPGKAAPAAAVARPAAQTQVAASAPAPTPTPVKPSAAASASISAPVPPPAPSATQPAAAPALAPAPAKKITDETLWIHDDLDLDALNLDEELARLEEEEQQLSRDFLAVERAPKPEQQLLGQLNARRDPHDESWAEQLLAEPKASPVPPQAPRIAARESVITPPAAVETRIEPAIAPLTSQAQADDEDDDGLHPDFRQHEGDSSLRLSADIDSGHEPEEDEHEPTISALPPRARIEEIELTASAPLRSEPALRNESLLNLSEEPLQLDWQQAKKPWGRWIGWSLLNLIGASALAAQYVSYHFDELARQDQYRPWFEQLCPEIGCKLPSKVDVAQIKSSNLVVRSHPEFNGALVVDAILYNRALFSQPFPLLELRFADMNGQLLASRRFKPGEYLGGELAGQAEMPPQTPIHISLDILDPGAKAVNYSLSFFSPE